MGGLCLYLAEFRDQRLVLLKLGCQPSEMIPKGFDQVFKCCLSV